MLQIANPEFLILLIFVPFIIYYSIQREKNFYIKYPVVDFFKNKNRSFTLKIIVNSLILIFIILALCNFQKRKTLTNITARGINIIIALDTSGSMAALDFTKNKKTMNRLQALKYVVKKFIAIRKNDKIGLVVFGKYAFTQCPLTVDHETLKMFIDQLNIGMAGDSTAIGSALILSIKRLKDVKGKSKIIILVTDGRNNAGEVDPIIAAKLAKKFNIKIYTIGIGTKGKPVPIPQQTIFGIRTIYVNVDLDDYTLKNIAKITGGLYFNAENFPQLMKIIRNIDKLEKTKYKEKKYYEITYLYYYFLWPALFLLLIKIFYIKGIKQSIP